MFAPIGTRIGRCVAGAVARPLRAFEDGCFYEISDRTLGEIYRLLPSAFVNATILAGVTFALAAVPGVQLIGFTVLSNHWHILVRSGADPTGVSRFMQVLKSHVARVLRDHQGMPGTLWSRRFASIAVLDGESVLRRLVYFILNPVKAGLCAAFEEWPGISTTLHLLGVRSACGDVGVRLGLPPSWEGLSEEQLGAQRAQLLAEVRAHEAQLADERKNAGLPRPHVRQALRRLSHADRPERPKRGPKPQCFAATVERARSFRGRMREWALAFRIASAAFRAGQLEVMFPACAQPPRLLRPPVEAAA